MSKRLRSDGTEEAKANDQTATMDATNSEAETKGEADEENQEEDEDDAEGDAEPVTTGPLYRLDKHTLLNVLSFLQVEFDCPPNKKKQLRCVSAIALTCKWLMPVIRIWMMHSAVGIVFYMPLNHPLACAYIDRLNKLREKKKDNDDKPLSVNNIIYKPIRDTIPELKLVKTVLEHMQWYLYSDSEIDDDVPDLIKRWNMIHPTHLEDLATDLNGEILNETIEIAVESREVFYPDDPPDDVCGKDCGRCERM